MAEATGFGIDIKQESQIAYLILGALNLHKKATLLADTRGYK